MRKNLITIYSIHVKSRIEINLKVARSTPNFLSFIRQLTIAFGIAAVFNWRTIAYI